MESVLSTGVAAVRAFSSSDSGASSASTSPSPNHQQQQQFQMSPAGDSAYLSHVSSPRHWSTPNGSVSSYDAPTTYCSPVRRQLFAVPGAYSPSRNNSGAQMPSSFRQAGSRCFGPTSASRYHSSSSAGGGGATSKFASNMNRPNRNTFNEPNSGMRDVPMWLKSLRLHKYTGMFQQMDYEQMLALDDQKLEEQSVTKGARRKILQSVHKLRDRVPSLKQMDKDLAAEPGTVRTNLLELRSMVHTPIRQYPLPGRPEADQAKIDGLNTPLDQLDPENLPAHFIRVLGKVHVTVFESPETSLEDEYLSALMHIYDTVGHHESFTLAQRQRVQAWKRALRKVFNPALSRQRHNEMMMQQFQAQLDQQQQQCGGRPLPLNVTVPLQHQIPGAFPPPSPIATRPCYSSGSECSPDRRRAHPQLQAQPSLTSAAYAPPGNVAAPTYWSQGPQQQQQQQQHQRELHQLLLANSAAALLNGNAANNSNNMLQAPATPANLALQMHLINSLQRLALDQQKASNALSSTWNFSGGQQQQHQQQPPAASATNAHHHPVVGRHNSAPAVSPLVGATGHHHQQQRPIPPPVHTNGMPVGGAKEHPEDIRQQKMPQLSFPPVTSTNVVVTNNNNTNNNTTASVNNGGCADRGSLSLLSSSDFPDWTNGVWNTIWSSSSTSGKSSDSCSSTDGQLSPVRPLPSPDKASSYPIGTKPTTNLTKSLFDRPQSPPGLTVYNFDSHIVEEIQRA